MAPPFRARACWAPARSAAEAADELRLRLAEACDALKEQRREHARLREVKRAFEANLASLKLTEGVDYFHFC